MARPLTTISNKMTLAFNCECDNHVHEIVSYSQVEEIVVKSGFPYAKDLAHSMCAHGVIKRRGEGYVLGYISVNSVQPLLTKCQNEKKAAQEKAKKLKNERIASAVRYLEKNGYIVTPPKSSETEAAAAYLEKHDYIVIRP